MELIGIPVSEGIAIGQVYIYRRGVSGINRGSIRPEDADKELEKFRRALEKSKLELQAVRDKACREIGDEEACIFDAHMSIVDDPDFINLVEKAIVQDNIHAEHAVERTMSGFYRTFLDMEDEYIRERAADVKDVGSRIITNILGTDTTGFAGIHKNAIVIADDLTSSDIVLMDHRQVSGFVTGSGGRNSHTAIIARSLEMPAVTGLENITELVRHNDAIIVDGIEGKVIVRPDNEQIKAYRERMELYRRARQKLGDLAGRPAVTTDGRHVDIMGNIGEPGDIDRILKYGGDGVGLFRTEMLYIDSEYPPDEEEQFAQYRQAVEMLAGKPLTIRTLDIGGDKGIACINTGEEGNPFLGMRAIRLCLKEKDMFKAQLKAILRASSFGPVNIMYPMISCIEEIHQANALLEEAKAELERRDEAFSRDIYTGIMIEVPSAAITADLLAREVDFFSIGTNDLCQYTLAADRLNTEVAHLYKHFDPAVIRLIKYVTEAAHKYGKRVGVCGEIAGDPAAVPLLLGLGVDELSMSAVSMLKVKNAITKMSYKDASDIAAKVLQLMTAAEVEEYLRGKASELGL